MYQASEKRYDKMPYRKCGNSGLRLPAISLGLWQNFGSKNLYENSKEIILYAFDNGITHFDLANNYGPVYGSAELTFGRVLKEALMPYRDELIISTKAGFDMWPGPYGIGGSRKYLLASLDQSLERMGLKYVDIYYSHRYDSDSPLEETMGALATAVLQGKALYAGISNYDAQKTAEAADIMKSLGVPLLIHQPSYSMLNRWVETDRLTDVLDDKGMGSIAFSPLSRGMLTSRYLGGTKSEDSRADRNGDDLDPNTVEKVRKLNEISKKRGQTMAQMALAWVLRGERITSALIGASRVSQVIENLGAIDNLDFSDAELREIDNILA